MERARSRRMRVSSRSRRAASQRSRRGGGARRCGRRSRMRREALLDLALAAGGVLAGLEPLLQALDGAGRGLGDPHLGLRGRRRGRRRRRAALELPALLELAGHGEDPRSPGRPRRSGGACRTPGAPCGPVLGAGGPGSPPAGRPGRRTRGASPARARRPRGGGGRGRRRPPSPPRCTARPPRRGPLRSPAPGPPGPCGPRASTWRTGDRRDSRSFVHSRPERPGTRRTHRLASRRPVVDEGPFFPRRLGPPACHPRAASA